MITRSSSRKPLYLIVNATLLVIISTPQRRPLEAAVVVTGAAPTSSLEARAQQQQQLRESSPITTSAHHHHHHHHHHLQREPAAKPTSERTSAHTAPSIGASGGSARLMAPSVAAHETNALVYLQRYGYMQAPTAGDTSNNLISEESFSRAIGEFQRFAGLPETGQVDNQTLNMMQAPRCGNTDKPMATISKTGQLTSRPWLTGTTVAVDTHNDVNGATWASARRRRQKRYALQGSKWRRQELTYRISQYPTKFAGARRHEVDSQIERAFGIWSQVAPIDFVVKREGRVHIDIRFASGDHGDGDAFDGPGNTLAHAYFPQYGGDAHFDDQEFWTVDSYAGTNIFQVAAHELGHSLGLGHSNVREALMAPFYQKYKPNFKLHIDDVLAIQALYGEKAFLPGDVPGAEHHVKPTPAAATTPTTTTTTSTTTTTTTASPTTATGGAATSGSTSTSTSAPPRPGTAFGARSPPIYRGNRRPPLLPPMPMPPLAPPPPQPPASDEGPKEPNSDKDEPVGIPDLSANGLGDGFVGQAGGPADEPTTGSSAPADLCSDSVIDTITRTEDGNSYVFKGDYYWLVTSDGLARGYPRRIATDWDGLPGQLDAALTWADGKTFFFKGNKYWRFRNQRRDPGYPKLISAGFAGIPDDIDAAFVWSGNGRTYFFRGAEYWRFDSKAEPPVSSEYPRSIKVWLGVPAYVNAAFKWDNNVTYFFKGNQYYRFNDREFKVEARGRPPFPRQTSEWWFGCVGSNLAQRAMPTEAGQTRNINVQSEQHQQQQQQTQITSRTARLHPNYHHQPRNPTAALHSMPAPAQHLSHDHNDWSFLAGLSPDQTRSMGTHISDHHKPPAAVAQPTPSTTIIPDRRWREEETLSELDINRRLEPDPQFTADASREPLYNSNSANLPELPPGRRRPPTPTSVRMDNGSSDRHKTGFEFSAPTLASHNQHHHNHQHRNGPQYQTSSSSSPATTTTAIISTGQALWTDGATITRWISVLASSMVVWLSTIQYSRRQYV